MKRIKLTVPASVLHTAKLASQAMDPDVGGFNAFEIVEDDARYSYTVDVSDQYFEAFSAFLQMPDLLRDSIARDFAQRFPESTPPTLDDCAAFVAQLQLEVIECLS